MKKKSMLSFIVSIFIASISLQTANAQTWNLAGNADANNGSKLGTTNNFPVTLYTNDNPRMIIDPSGNVGIGIASPINILTVKIPGAGGVPAASWLAGGSPPVFMGFGEGLATGFNLATAGNSPGYRPVLNSRRSRGTLAVPAGVLDNDVLGSFVASGHDGINFQNPATIDFYVDGAPSAGNVPARISFVTGTNVLNRLERLKIGSTGDVSIVAGNLLMGSATKTIQFATPVAGSAAMMTMFPSGTGNTDRMVISHSPGFPTYGLQYQDASDKFNFLSNGTPVLTADLSSERVGVGTASPAFKLDVVGRMRMQAGGGTAGTWLTNVANTADAAFVGMFGDNNVGLFGNSGASWGLTMNVSTAQVDVRSGDLVMGSATKTIQFASPVAASAPMMTMFPSGTSNPARMVISHSPGFQNFGLQYQDVTDKFNFLSNGAPVLTADLGNQRVGIGTSSPSFLLDVAGRMRLRNGGGTSGTWFMNAANTVDAAFVGMVNDSYVGLFGSSGPGWGFVMNVVSGNVGIGTTSPNYKLDVCGTIRAKEVRVESGWCDYVFAKDYHLRPLEYVAAYVEKNQHLPGIPSAKEIQENGLPIAETQTKMMEKVEEMTLYVIQLNDKIKLLEKKIEKLTKGKK